MFSSAFWNLAPKSRGRRRFLNFLNHRATEPPSHGADFVPKYSQIQTKYDQIRTKYGRNTFKYVRNTIKYGRNTLKYKWNTVKYGRNTVKYERNTVKYEWNTIKYERNTVKYATNTVKYERNTITYGRNTVKYDWNTIKYGRNTINYGWNTIKYCVSDSFGSVSECVGSVSAVFRPAEEPLFQFSKNSNVHRPAGRPGWPPKSRPARAAGRTVNIWFVWIYSNINEYDIIWSNII